MEKFFVADSYKDMTPVGEPFENEKGKMYVNVKGVCPRCGGLGFIVSRVENGHPIPIPVDGGVCYLCNGEKTITKAVRAYTEKEYLRKEAAKAKAQDAKAKAKIRKEQDLIENAETYKHEIALKLGFGEDEKAYLVYGDDTFAIKDELKKLGARFDPTLKWFFAKKVDLPAGYNLCEMSFDELYIYNPRTKWAEFKEDAKAIVSKRIAELKGPSTSEFYPGEIKERIYNITAKIKSIRGFEGMYGYTSVYTFTSQNYVFVWMTSKCDSTLAVGDTVDLTGTIKKFDEYMGINNTYLTRCKVVKIEN